MGEGGGGPAPKPNLKIGKDQAARPLAGAEVLVAEVGPSPRRGEGKTKTKITLHAYDPVLGSKGASIQ